MQNLSSENEFDWHENEPRRRPFYSQTRFDTEVQVTRRWPIPLGLIQNFSNFPDPGQQGTGTLMFVDLLRIIAPFLSLTCDSAN